MSRFSMIGGLLLGFAFFAAEPEDTRRPIPTTEATAKAEKLVKELFKADFLKTKPADRSTFSAKLLEQAENEADVAAAFVFYRDARDVAAKAGDLSLYRAAAKGLARSYRIEESDALAGTIDTLATTMASNGPSPEMAREMIDCVDDAVRAGEFAAAHKLLKAAETVVRRAGAPRSAAAVAARLKSLPAVQTEFERLPEARKALESDPADKKANLLLGKFTCFVKNDWETGLARLLLGAEGEIQLAVDKDIAAGAGKGAERIQAADQWHKLATLADPFRRNGLDARSLLWYRQGVDSLTGLEKIRVEKLIGDLESAASDWEDLTRRMNDPKAWRTTGSWTFDGKAVHGDGIAAREFLGRLPSDCVVQLRMTVMKGNHTHFYLADAPAGGSCNFGCEGKSAPRLKIRGKGTSGESGPGHVVKLNEEMRVKLAFKKNRVTAWVNDAMASTAVRADSGVRFKILVGVGKNSGSSSYWDFRVSPDGK